MARRRTRTRCSSNRRRSNRLGLLDWLLLACMPAGVLYLLLTWLGVPAGAASIFGLIVLGFTLGIVAFCALLLGVVSMAPRWRSPIVVNIRRRR